jgi:hypothetical protein
LTREWLAGEAWKPPAAIGISELRFVVLMNRQKMAKLALLGIQIVLVMGISSHVQLYPFNDINTV